MAKVGMGLIFVMELLLALGVFVVGSSCGLISLGLAGVLGGLGA